MERKWLYAEAFLYLGWARVLKQLPFAKVAPTLGVRTEESSFAHDPSQDRILAGVSTAIQRMSRHTWWESMCMVKAIAAMKMLERRGISCTLYMGTAKDATGRMIAHAWLRSGPHYLTGYEEMSKFTVVGKFANNGHRKKQLEHVRG
ncbi:lasso peptide biosynthesis B2 protein [Paenibacillus sp. PR3]|uniref:Lasso peptide biosynthesis B2 protein n=1 Tax=Paenibacillus terricola TaxID=2763503 RepID=A0ABR8N279_9BACL|nr:lasso peptide biosynthesis B2 protein [Paenibacillus terricola]MBD3921502.1 lasso peptide biosynthesis B2 protein [Paenibacillus terricola]